MKHLAQLFPHVCGHILVRDSPREAVRAIFKCLIFSSSPREVNFSPNFARTHEERAELTASRGIVLRCLG